MTPEERELVQYLVITSDSVKSTEPKAEFVRRFPAAIEKGRLAASLLEQAEEAKSSEDLQCALIVGFSFGFDSRQKEILGRLLEATWHYCHEDLVAALRELRVSDQATVDSLYRATQWVPSYLAFDESRALATKAIWALGETPGNEADAALLKLAICADSRIRDVAKRQLDRRRG
jgi:hypothetical protein